VRERSHQRSDDRGAFDSRFDAAFQPGFEPEAAPADTGALGLLGFDDPAPSASHDEPQAVPVPRRAPARPLIDGFIVALWVVGGVAALGGVLLMAAAPGLAASSEFTQNYLMLVMLAQAAPLLLALGLATVIGTIFLLATRWERRP
jgi:hypothetical protein